MSSNKICCNPFSAHGRRHLGNLRNVSDKIYKQAKSLLKNGIIQDRISRDSSICEKCRKLLSKNHSNISKNEKSVKSVKRVEVSTIAKSSSQTSDPSFSTVELSQGLAASQETFHPSPLQMGTITLSNVKEKLNELLRALNMNIIDETSFRNKSYKQKLLSGLNTNLSTLFEVDARSIDAETTAEIISQLKRKFNDSGTSRKERMKILSVLPMSWGIQKIVDEFEVSSFTAKRVKDVVLKHGILHDTEQKSGKSLELDIVETVREFYRNDKISRNCPGKKDFVTIRENGEKRQLQRRLVLMNLNEAYQIYKDEHPTRMLSFSKFAELRPKECILAGQSNGIHATCVCQQHQNVALKFEAIRRTEGLNFSSMRGMMYAMLCSNKTERCHLLECSKCSNEQISDIESSLLNTFEHNDIDELKYKQWLKVESITIDLYLNLYLIWFNILISLYYR